MFRALVCNETTMVGPRRPQFVLFGSSIVQGSFYENGWGGNLVNTYARQADIILRGYAGWNSRQALEVVDVVFPKNEAVQPSLVIVYFGGNDSALPNLDNLASHVPLAEYVENMRKIAIHLQSLSENTRLLFLTTPPVNEAQMLEMKGINDRTNEQCKIYADACERLCQEMNIKVINLFVAIQQRDDWLMTCFADGIHLSLIGSKIVEYEILKAINEADWKPSLDCKYMPIEFDVSLDGKRYQRSGGKGDIRIDYGKVWIGLCSLLSVLICLDLLHRYMVI